MTGVSKFPDGGILREKSNCDLCPANRKIRPAKRGKNRRKKRRRKKRKNIAIYKDSRKFNPQGKNKI